MVGIIGTGVVSAFPGRSVGSATSPAKHNTKLKFFTRSSTHTDCHNSVRCWSILMINDFELNFRRHAILKYAQFSINKYSRFLHSFIELQLNCYEESVLNTKSANIVNRTIL